MRSQAARVWLMTISSKLQNTEAAKIQLGVHTIWTMLQMVPGEKTAKAAPYFTGEYYNNIRSENLSPSYWPQNSV
jgi:hypothetical protein